MAVRRPTPGDLADLAEAMRGVMVAEGVKGNIAYDRENQRLLNESVPPIALGGLVIPWMATADEAERADVVRRYVRAHLRGRQPIPTWAEARGRVLPKVRPELEHVSWALRQGLEGMPVPPMPTGAVTEHLRMRFVWEIENGTASVLAEDVERWGVSLDELQDAAHENLARRTPGPIPWLGAPESPGVFRSSWRDGFDATRVLIVRELDLPFAARPLAVATGAKDVFVADSTDDEALFQLGLAAQRAARESPEFVWLWPLLLDGEHHRHWLPPEGSGGHAPLSVCAANHAQIVYNMHGKLLERALRAEGSFVEVGSVGMVQTPLGAAATVAVWGEAPVPVAVAHADLVQFQRGTEILGLAPFERVRAVMGDLLEEMPGYPQRFRGHLFPEAWQLAQMDLAGGT
jgi:hypothetical protein